MDRYGYMYIDMIYIERVLCVCVCVCVCVLCKVYVSLRLGAHVSMRVCSHAKVLQKTHVGMFCTHAHTRYDAHTHACVCAHVDDALG